MTSIHTGSYCVTMATEFDAGMSEETARELMRVRREVLIAKQELGSRFEQYSRMLRDKHLEMEARLDDVVRVAETQATDKQTKMNQLTIAKAEMLQTLQHNELLGTVTDVSRKLDEEMERLSAIVDQVPSVWLEWRDEWLEDGMRDLCHVCEGVSYVHRQNPVWTGVSKGYGQNELFSPQSLVTDRDNGEVFVCDCMSDRIQVYGKDGNYQRRIKHEELSIPYRIAITPHQLFVSCIGISHRILKLDKLSGSIMSIVTLEYLLSCITTDTDTLYAGTQRANQILHLSLEDMSTMKITSLNSPYTRQDTELLDLKVTTSLFVVLFHSSNKPIQTFSREGNLIRIIASEEQLTKPNFLCLDRHYNIIVSNIGAHNLKVFSSEGDLIAIIGHYGTGPGEFHTPHGIDVDREGRIVVVDRKHTHKLQFF